MMPRQKRTALVAIAVANFIVQLSMIPVSAILPTISVDFGVEPSVASWVMTAYLLTLTSFVLVAGRLGDLYGHREVFIVGTIVFTISSVSCTFVQDIGSLIALRALQGLGVAMFSGVSLAIIAHAFTAKERGGAIGVAGTGASAGGVVGVLVSTSLAQYLNWQYLFLLSLPFGLIALKAGLDLKLDSRPSDRPKVDYLGAILLATTLTAFSLSLSHLHEGEGTFSEGWVYHGGLVVVMVMAAALFVLVERRAAQPMIRLSYLANKSLSYSLITNEILHMTMMASTFLMPFLIERGLGYVPLYTAGLVVASRAANMVMAPLSGIFYDRTHWRFLCPVAMVGMTVGLAALALLGPTLSYQNLFLLVFTVGLVLGFFLTPNNTIIMGSVSNELRGFASGMQETTRQLGHTLGISFSSAVMGFSLAGIPEGTPQNTAYIVGFQDATMAGAIVALLGVVVALGYAYTPQARAAGAKRLAKANG